MANKQCPMSIGTTGEISSITFDGTDVIYNLLMNEDYLDLDALGKNTDAMKSAVMVMFKNPKGEIKSMLEMVVDTKSGIRLIYKGEDNSPNIVYPVDEKGHLKAVVSCGENPTFKIDIESGILWQESVGDPNAVYSLGEEDLESE